MDNHGGAASSPSHSFGSDKPGLSAAASPNTVGIATSPVHIADSDSTAPSGGAPSPSSIPDPTIGNSSGASLNSFPYFPVYVLDNNNGVVLFPGAYQSATLGGYVDLEAQVSGTTVSSYSWGTSGVSSNASHLSATNTYQLTFQWTGTVLTPKSEALRCRLPTSIAIPKLTLTISGCRRVRTMVLAAAAPTPPGRGLWRPIRSLTRRQRSSVTACRSTPTAAHSTPRFRCPAIIPISPLNL